jgi:O-antigen ligase
MPPISRLASPAREFDPKSLIPGTAVAAGALAGILIAASPPLGLGLVLIACFALIVGLNLPAALSVAAGILFLRHLSAVSIAPTVMALLLLSGWTATLRSHRQHVAHLVRQHRKLANVVLGMLLWVSMSVLWASDPQNALSEAWPWYLAAIVFLLVATTVRKPEHVRMIVAGFVAGAVVSVLIGLVGGGLTSSADAVERATETEGRLQGGGGDPNYLAAGLVPAGLLAGALVASSRRVVVRIALVAAIALLAVGLVATQSRAGLLAAAVACLATLVVQRGRGRLCAAALISLVVGVGALWLAANPEAWQRVSSFDDGGNGRSDIWLVASRMTEDHPLVGVGIGDFPLRSREYVREPGNLNYVRLIAEQPQVVHNTYLQVLVETGAIGLGLFLAAVVGCIAAAWRAARLLDNAYDGELAGLARAVVMAQFALLAASFFISNETDLRLWVLLGLGPALLTMARAFAAGSGAPARSAMT